MILLLIDAKCFMTCDQLKLILEVEPETTRDASEAFAAGTGRSRMRREERIRWRAGAPRGIGDAWQQTAILRVGWFAFGT